MTRIGLISDTHGLLRPEAEAWLQGSDAIGDGVQLVIGPGYESVVPVPPPAPAPPPVDDAGATGVAEPETQAPVVSCA